MALKNKVVGYSKQNIFRLYEPMLIILLIFGYNFDFYNNHCTVKIFARVYCFSLVTIVAYATLICCNKQEISQIWSLLEYSLSVLMILFFKSKMRLFLEKLCEVDTYLRIRKTHSIWEKYRIYIITFIVWNLRVYYTYIFCTFYECYNDFGLYLVSALSPIALDLNRVWRCIIFDTIRYRLKILRVRLEECPGDEFYLYIKDNKSIREDKLSFCLKLYRSIADLMELVSPELHASLFMSVVCNLPKIIVNTYHVLRILEGLEPYEGLVFSIIHLAQISILLFVPFVIVEFYAIEVDKIKLFLAHKLMEDVDNKTKATIQLFIQYTEIRTFKYRIWRIIPINVTLPLDILNLCITYVIVVINFTHLYG